MQEDESPAADLPREIPPPPEAPSTKPHRADLLFDVDDLQHDLGRRTARGGLYTAMATGLSAVVTTVGTVLITRELTDDDFGLYGMVLVLAGFARMFVDLGLSQAVIQKPKITHAQVSTLFWINLGIAAVLAVVVAAATPLLVWFYDEPRIAPINLAMAGLFVVSALGLQHRALLRRRLEFGRLNVVAGIVPLISTTVAVAIALLGGGVWALVAIPAVAQLVTAIGMWIASGWIPGPPRRGQGVRTMLAFGGHVTGFQFINYFARNADNAMLGFAWGAGPLGLYTRAYSLMMLPANKVNAPLTGLVVPALSRVNDQPERFRTLYLNCLSLVALGMTPLVGWLIVTAEEAVPLILGPQWTATVEVFYALSPGCLMAATTVANGWLYMSVGHVHVQLRWSYLQSFILIAAMAVGLQWGPIGMALAVSVAYTISKPIGLTIACRGTPVALRQALAAIYLPILLTSGAMGLVLGLAYWADGVVGAWGMLTLKSVVYLALVAGLTLAIPYNRRRLKEAMKTLKGLRNKKPADKTSTP